MGEAVPEYSPSLQPLDGTGAYVSGKRDCRPLPLEGLDVTTVLIGAFDMTTGAPLLGVAAQPFFRDHVE